MRALENFNARSIAEAVNAAQEATGRGQAFAYSGGGTDLLQQIKDGTAPVDLIINLRSIPDANLISTSPTETVIGGLITLTDLASDSTLAARTPVLTEAAASVATPQIRNVATLAGNITQRPWCWYYRNGFQCYKAGGDRCYSVNGENQQHAIFGGGPSFIVHPSDTAPALVALHAAFEVAGPQGNRTLSAEEFFVLPSQNPARENSMLETELLTAVRLPLPATNAASTYFKLMDREAWTHAEVSVAVVIERSGAAISSASVVLGGVAPMPWRLPEVERFLVGQTLNASVAQRAGVMAVADAQPLAKNAYKLPMTSAAVERALLRLVVA